MPTKYPLTLLVFLLVLISCSDKSRDQSSVVFNANVRFADSDTFSENWSRQNTVVYHTISEPDNLHPTNGNSTPRSEIFLYTQQYLINTDYANLSLAPGLVEALPDVSADGLEYSYTLRSGVRWDDGSPLTAEDILFTAKAFKCPLTNDPGVKGYWENLSDVRLDALHPEKFMLIMKEKYIQNIAFLSSFPVLEKKFHDPKNLLGKFSLRQFDDTAFHAGSYQEITAWASEFNDDSNGRDVSKLNGLGPYRVTTWDPGISITLEKKKNYWSRAPKITQEQAFPEKIIFRVNKDENSTLLEFKSQTFDVSTSISTSAFIELDKNPEFKKNYNLALTSSYNYTYIAMNERPDSTRQEMFTDSVVRHAMALLTPVESITKIVYHEYSDKARPIASNVSPMKKSCNRDLKPVPFDPSEASAMLAQAGWKDTDGDGVLDKIINGKKISLSPDLYYLSTSPDWKDIASLIAESWTKAGVRVTPVPVDIRAFIEKARNHDFDLLLGSWSATSLPEDYTQLWHTSSWKNHGSNYTGFGNSQSDALIDSIRQETSEDTRIPMEQRLQKLIYDNHPYVFLYSSLRRNVVHKRFHNVILYPDRPGILLNTLELGIPK